MSISNASFGSYGNIGLAYLKLKSSITLTAATDTKLPGFSTVITPTSSSSSILCLCSFSGYITAIAGVSFARNGTNLSNAGSVGSRIAAQACDAFVTNGNNACVTFMCYLDSPASTSAQTYTVIANDQGQTVSINNPGAANTYVSSSYVILLEI